ncbi:acyltransferase [Pseudomonas sp. Mn2068]|uniref:acyltransferase n=1 Tax=Pseudomonas sp. Mn2068 TaxID=3395265 RepID=UPI003BE82CAD
MKAYRSEGPGTPDLSKFARVGNNVIIEDGVRVFHPENIELGDNVYIGHDTILKGYYKDRIIIGNNVWIGQGCFIHGAGGIEIGDCVGIGPGVKIHAAYHEDIGRDVPIMFQSLSFAKIIIEEDVNVGIGAIIMNGVTVSKGSKVGAGAVLTKSFPEYSIVAGVPAKLIRKR